MNEIKRFYDNGTQLQFEETYLNGKLHGLSRGFHRNGNPDYEEIYNNGSLVNRKIYYINGLLQCETNYKKGKKEGKYTAYHENGKLHLECNYIKSKIYGSYKIYSEDGNLIEELHFVKGKICS